MGYCGGFCLSEPRHGLGHDASRIVAATTLLPARDLIDRVGGGLTSDRRIPRPDTQTIYAVTGRAGRNIPRRIAAQPDRRRSGRSHVLTWRRHVGIEDSDRPSLPLIEMTGDPRHRIVVTKIGRVILHLLLQIPRIQPRQKGHRDAVACAIQPMTGETGIARPAVTAAHRHQFAGPRQGFSRVVRRQGTAAHCKQQTGGDETDRTGHASATMPYRQGSPEP